MDRCAAAYQYHKAGYNCAQAVALAFKDLIDVPEGAIVSAGGGFGGGVGGSRAELCGAVSGGVLTLGWLTPHTNGADAEGKKRTYAAVKEFRRRFEDIFGLTRCGDLLAARPQPSEKTPAALRLGVTAHCDNMIVTAVEIIEEMLAERETA